ncbi:MAG: tetratricopeptide repeat protein [Spirochaetia bacterium]|nr:tetratricopeptide repeat protein [Spirochaetia bacterium]
MKYLINIILYFFLVNTLIYSQTQKSDNNSELLFKKGKKYFFENKYDAAGEIMKNIIAMNPNHAEALSILGDISLIKKEYYTALSYYKKAESESINPAIENFRMGQVYIKLDKPEESIQCFNKALLLDPSMKINLYQIGYVELVLNRNKYGTIENWRKFVNEAPTDYQNEKIRQVLKLLEDPNFKLPSRDSDITLEDALLLGGQLLEAASVETKDDTAGHEKAKTNNQTQELLEDNDL